MALKHDKRKSWCDGFKLKKQESKGDADYYAYLANTKFEQASPRHSTGYRPKNKGYLSPKRGLHD